MDELKRQFKVVDMMLSMHAKLRDRNLRLSLISDLFLLLCSVVLCSLVFVDTRILSQFGVAPAPAQTALGLLSIIVFMISLVQFRVDWKEKGEKHSHACEALSRLKVEYRALLKSEQPPADKMKNLSAEYAWTLSSLPRIPESRFHALKFYHHRKILLSKMIDSNPGSSLIMLKWRIWIDGIRAHGEGTKISRSDDASD